MATYLYHLGEGDDVVFAVDLHTLGASSVVEMFDTIRAMKLNIFQAESTTNHDGTANLVRLLQNLPGTQVIQTLNYAWLDGGQRLKEHTHLDCVEYYLFLSGIGEMTIGEEKIEVERGDFVTVQAGEMHTLVNNGREQLEFVTLRALVN